MTKHSIAFRVLRGIIIIAAVVLILVLWSENHVLKEQNEGMLSVVSNQQNSISIPLREWEKTKVTFRTAECQQICADLDSKDPVKLEQWRKYFRHAVETDLRATFQQRLNLYNTRERPERSLYFIDLLSGLMGTHVPVTNLIAYLGEPDSTSNSAGRTVLVYRIDVVTGSAIAIVRATNDILSDVDFDLAGPPTTPGRSKPLSN